MMDERTNERTDVNAVPALSEIKPSLKQVVFHGSKGMIDNISNLSR